jgi:hypothetical protein|tara:strand:- start:583 stop:759 length:177 start_codon:yes stop_codon:yes gene_type:complete
MKVGDRVEILQAEHISGLKHRKPPVYGYIERIDEEYVYVRPTWRTYLIELYRSELKHV